MKKRNKELKEIVEMNQDLNARVESENWSVSYDKKSDMLLMGGSFPVGSFYYSIDDSGLLVRIDKDKKIYGFAIENTKLFVKENPDIAFAVFAMKHPKIVYYGYYIIYRTAKGVDSIKNIMSVSNNFIGRAVLSNA